MKHIVTLALLLFAHAASATVDIPALFSDGLVLQRGRDVPVWGWADTGSSVSVSFGGHTVTATTPASGKWMVRLPALPASAESRALTITVGEHTKVIEDVVVGDVWLCSGQSNMAYNLKGLARKTRDPKHQPIADYVANELATAADPLLRQITVPRVASALKATTNFDGSWIKSAPATNGAFTGTGYFFARELRRQAKVPIGLINAAWGGTLVEPWIPPSGFNAAPDLKAFYDQQHAGLAEKEAAWNPADAKRQHEKRIAAWKKKVAEAKAARKRPPGRPRLQSSPASNNRVPSALFNGMIHQLIPFAIRGTIWYQGESNQHQHAKEYSAYFGRLITSWRTLWGQGDFPFYYCQLAQFQQPPAEPLDDNGWVHVCDQQRRTLALPNTGMAVLNDIGEAKDIHPRNKIEAGQRLALWALAREYGKTVPAFSGPLYRDHRIQDGKVIITFDHAGSGLMVGAKPLLGIATAADGPLKRFQICGKDRTWRWAEATITGKDTVTVSHPEIPAPAAVRYAWAPNPEGANLYNREGLPASCFRTDTW